MGSQSDSQRSIGILIFEAYLKFSEQQGRLCFWHFNIFQNLACALYSYHVGREGGKVSS